MKDLFGLLRGCAGLVVVGREGSNSQPLAREGGGGPHHKRPHAIQHMASAGVRHVSNPTPNRHKRGRVYSPRPYKNEHLRRCEDVC